MSAQNLDRRDAPKGDDRADNGFVHHSITMSDDLSVFERFDGPEPSSYLVRKVKKRYHNSMFYADNRLVTYFISKGLTRDEAQAATPTAERVLADLASKFRQSALAETACPLEMHQKTPALPDVAPELFEVSKGRPKKGKDIISHLRRVWYDPYIKSGVLTRADLGRLDPAAYLALSNHLRKKDLPRDWIIPTLSEKHDATILPELATLIKNSDENMLRAIRAFAERELKHCR
jgi:hypothetical protein